MEQTILGRVQGANQKLHRAIAKIRDSLAGRVNFTPEDVRAIAEPVSQMAPIVGDAEHLRAAMPELENQFVTYAKNLEELQNGLDKVRCVLLARCAQMEAQRGHLDTLRMWAATWQQTQ